MVKLNSIDDYYDLLRTFKKFDKDELRESLRFLCRTDLFFLLWYVLKRKDIEHPWLLARCKEVQKSPNEHLDLWARAHYKSTIITFAKTIQDVLINPNITISIFSHTRPIAKTFLRQIKREFEANTMLKSLFPDILWKNPRKESSKWSDDDGIIVKRNCNPKESTIEAWGIVDGQPTSRHFDIMVYDDVVTAESVYTPEMNRKTIERWELSTNLLSNNGVCRYIGTRYSFNDLYRELMKKKIVTPRVYPATDNGTALGNPVFLTREKLDKKRKEQGPYTFSAQMLQNPTSDTTQGFRKNWLSFYQCRAEKLLQVATENMNVYILVDAASAKKKNSDYTVMAVIGCNNDKKFYLLDMIRDRINLKEKCEALFKLVKKWRPLFVGYEKYGMMSDIEHIIEKQQERLFFFTIRELHTKMSKQDRIARLVPLFANGEIYLPFTLMYVNYENKEVDLIKQFIEEEYLIYPVAVHEDILDAMSRIKDISYQFPNEGENDTFYNVNSQEYNRITGEPL